MANDVETGGPGPEIRPQSGWTVAKVDSEMILEGSSEVVVVPHGTERQLDQLATDCGGQAGAMLTVLAKRMPDQLPWNQYDHATFTIDFDSTVGVEKVASRTEMRERRVIGEADERLLDDEDIVTEVRRANISGDSGQKSGVVDRAYLKGYRGALRLGIFNDSIVPMYRAEPQPTNQLFVVVDRQQRRDRSTYNRLAMVAPGRNLPRYPSDRWFHGKAEIEAVPKVSVHDIREKLARGDEVAESEKLLVAEQVKCQDAWWNHGFIESSPGKEHFLTFEKPSLVVVVGPPNYTEDYVARVAGEQHFRPEWSNASRRKHALADIAERLDCDEAVALSCPPQHRKLLGRLASRLDVPARLILLNVSERNWDVASQDLSSAKLASSREAYESAWAELLLNASYPQEGFDRMKIMTVEQAEQISHLEFR